MNKEQKIKNAAKYWYECEKDGFPKSQEEVFKEWLKQDKQHQEEFDKLKDISNSFRSDTKEAVKTQDQKKINVYLYLLLILSIIFLAIILL